MKKFLIGFYLVALTCVSVFADFKTEFDWSLDNQTIIDRCLAEAKAAKNEGYTNLWSEQKLLVGKNSKNITYKELKSLITCRNLADRVILDNRFKKDFTKNVLSDNEICNNCKSYINFYYAARSTTLLEKGVWRSYFMKIAYLININDISEANLIFKGYHKNISISLSDNEIKEDLKIMKRAWYSNISKSEDWKKLLIEIELVSKSLE